MKIFKNAFLILSISVLVYLIFLFIWNLSYLSKIGKISLGENKHMYFIFYQVVDVEDEYDDLTFDFYRNDSLIIKQKYFDSTDGSPQVTDIKIRMYEGLFYITCFDSTKVKILCDGKCSVIFPDDYGGEKEDSIAKLPIVKKLLKDKNMTLGRW